MKKLFVLDAVATLFRSYFAIRGMTNNEGMSTNALYGFIRSVQKVMKDFDPEYFVAVFDGPNNKASRVEIYPEYKANRTGMPEDLVPQLEMAHAYCEAAGIPMISEPGVEADDVMGSIAKWAKEAGAEVFLISADKDLCQLIDEKVSLLQTHKDNLLLTPEKIQEIYGIKPEQFIDYLAIMGDSSDNIPGIAGFGPKTATKLLQEFGDLETLLANPDKLKSKKQQEKVTQEAEVARLSKKLATIQLNVDFPKESSFFHLSGGDNNKLRSLYEKMAFNTLVKELKTEAKPQEESAYHLIDTKEELEYLIEQMQRAKEICIDTETTSLNPMEAELVGVGLGIKSHEAFYIPVNGELGLQLVVESLKPLLANPKISFFGQNIKYDLHVLANHDLHVANVGFDTMIASYLLHPENNRHNLDLLVQDAFGFTKTPTEALIGKGKKQISMRDVAIQTVSDYCCEDVDYTFRLKELFSKESKINEILFEIEMPLLPILFEMERAGIFLNTDRIGKLSTEFNAKLKILEEEIYQLALEPFNIKSPKQLGEILFGKLQLKGGKKTKTGFSTNADVLEALQNEHPIIEKVLKYRLFEKLRSTYVDALPSQICEKTKRIHPTFLQTVTATGRLACREPNLQNIPIRSKEGKLIREAFEPQKKGWSYLAADYSQIELRILAHLSESPVLIDAFNNDADIHEVTASALFGTNSVTKEQRGKAKAVNFGLMYGQGAFGLSQTTNMDVKEAGAFIKAYFEQYPHIQSYLESCKVAARERGYTETLMKRQRPLPDINSKNGMLRSQSERLAVNTPIQGSQSDLMKMAMIALHKKLEPFEGYLILQIHDELIFECPDGELESLENLVKSVMEGIYPLKVPMKVDIAIGKNWAEC